MKVQGIIRSGVTAGRLKLTESIYKKQTLRAKEGEDPRIAYCGSPEMLEKVSQDPNKRGGCGVLQRADNRNYEQEAK